MYIHGVYKERKQYGLLMKLNSVTKRDREKTTQLKRKELSRQFELRSWDEK